MITTSLIIIMVVFVVAYSFYHKVQNIPSANTACHFHRTRPLFVDESKRPLLPSDKGRIRLLYSAFCHRDMYELIKHPRPSLNAKPELQRGSVLVIADIVQNFYGEFYRCHLPTTIAEGAFTYPSYLIPIFNAQRISLQQTS